MTLFDQDGILTQEGKQTVNELFPYVGHIYTHFMKKDIKPFELCSLLLEVATVIRNTHLAAIEDKRNGSV